MRGRRGCVVLLVGIAAGWLLGVPPTWASQHGRTLKMPLKGFVGLAAVAVEPGSVVGGTNANLTVRLGAPTREPLVVTLSSNSQSVVLPANVTVPAGQAMAMVQIGTRRVSAPTAVVITAAARGVTKNTGLALEPFPNVASVRVEPDTVWSGIQPPAKVWVTLDRPTPGSGVMVRVWSDNPGAEANVTLSVPPGQASANVSLGVRDVPARTTVTITARVGQDGEPKTGQVVVLKAPKVSRVHLEPQSVVGGKAVTGVVTLQEPAPGAVIVTLTSDSTAATVPASVTVAAGQQATGFSVSTQPVSATTRVNVKAILNNLDAATLEVRKPPALASLGVAPVSVVMGQSASGTATLDVPAPEPVWVALTSSLPAVTVPERVRVEAGQTTAQFPIGTQTLPATIMVTITGTAGGVQKTAQIEVRRP